MSQRLTERSLDEDVVRVARSLRKMKYLASRGISCERKLQGVLAFHEKNGSSNIGPRHWIRQDIRTLVAELPDVKNAVVPLLRDLKEVCISYISVVFTQGL